MSEIKELKLQLVEVQSQMAFQEDTVHALNEAMALQQQEILTLRQQLTLLKERQEEQARQMDQGADAPSLEEEKPPHY